MILLWTSVICYSDDKKNILVALQRAFFLYYLINRLNFCHFIHLLILNSWISMSYTSIDGSLCTFCLYMHYTVFAYNVCMWFSYGWFDGWVCVCNDINCFEHNNCKGLEIFWEAIFNIIDNNTWTVLSLYRPWMDERMKVFPDVIWT